MHAPYPPHFALNCALNSFRSLFSSGPSTYDVHKIFRWGPRLPDGYSQIFSLDLFGPLASGPWLRYATLQNLTPSFLGLRPYTLHPGAVQGKEVMIIPRKWIIGIV